MAETVKIPTHLTRLNRELSKSLVKYTNEYNIGAFSGIKKFEPLELFHSLSSFDKILMNNMMDSVFDVITDALTDMIVNETVAEIRKGNGVDSTAVHLATATRVRERIVRKRPFIIGRVAVVENENDKASDKIVIMLNPTTMAYELIDQTTNTINVPTLNSEKKEKYRKNVFDCDVISITTIEAIIESVAFNLSVSLQFESVKASGQNAISVNETPNTFALNTYRGLFDQLDDADKELVTTDKWKDDLEGITNAFARVLLGSVITCATINGINKDIASEYISKIDKKFFFTNEKGTRPTFTAMLSMGLMNLTRTIKMSDITMLVEYVNTHNTKQDESVAKYSQAITRMIKLLLDFGAAYTTAIMAESVKE